jgi:YggT family protein
MIPWFENFLALLLQILLMAIFVRVLLTWLPIDQSNPIVRVLFDVTEPVLAPFRRVIPRIGMFDLSPIAAMLIIQLILQNLPQIFRGLNAG